MFHNEKNDIIKYVAIVVFVAIVVVLILVQNKESGGSEQVSSFEVETTQSGGAEEVTEAAKTEEEAESEEATESEEVAESEEAAESEEESETEDEESAEAKEDSEEEYTFRNNKLLEEHYEKHGEEMGFESAEDYEEAASDVVTNPEALHKTEKEDGDYCYYLEDTNEFVVVSTDGYIRTYFYPSSGKKYYDNQ